jgi:ERCC4-type nuclease
MKIIIDIRESSLYEKCLAFDSKLTSFSKEVLTIGDIVIKSNDDIEMCIIERKSLQDLLSSIKDGRYEEQSHRLIHASGHRPHNILYIIEGQMSTIRTDIDKKLIYSCITSLNFYKGFSVLRSVNVQETCDLIIGISDKMERNIVKNVQPSWNLNTNEVDLTVPSYTSVVKKVKKENITKENIGQIILSQIPGISSVISEVIIKKFESIKGLILALESNNECLLGMTYELKGKERKISSTVLESVKKYLL